MKKITIAALLFLATMSSKAQGLESILLAADDASTLAENYLRPGVKGLMFDMNNGWYSTAKTHNLLGFDISVTANAAFVPSNDKTFAFNPGDYSYITLPNGESEIPTLMSDSDTETMVDVMIPIGNGAAYNVASFEMPAGIGGDLPMEAVPTPMVQAGVGLPFNTDLKLRFVPKVSFDDEIEGNLFGLGLQHDIMQYFGPLERLPLNVSILGAFTNMNVTYDIVDDNFSDAIQVLNGEAEFEMKTWTVQAVASIDLPIVSVYGGLGYNSGTSTTKIKGDYILDYEVQDSNGNTIGTVTEQVSNPVNLDFEGNGMRATLGARLNLAWFKIFADYTIQDYNTATVGMAFSFR